MASPNTLELREIPLGTEAAVCLCGEIFDHHLDKRRKGWKLKKAFTDGTHAPAGHDNRPSRARVKGSLRAKRP